MPARRRPSESRLEGLDFKIGNVKVQSSFLIRCLLNSPEDRTSGKPFSIQHVQTGAEFRAATLAEVMQWIEGQNANYLANASSQEGAL